MAPKIVDANSLEFITTMTAEQPAGTRTAVRREPEINKYFRAAIKTQASDLHLKVGQPPKLRLYGTLKNIKSEIMSPETIEELVFDILSPAQKERFLEHGTLDFAHEVDREHRFRVNIFRQRGMVSLAARRVNTRIPSFEELHLPPVLEKIAKKLGMSESETMRIVLMDYAKNIGLITERMHKNS